MPAEILAFPRRTRPVSDVLPEFPTHTVQIASDHYGNAYIDIAGTFTPAQRRELARQVFCGFDELQWRPADFDDGA